MRKIFLLFILFYSSFSLADSVTVYCIKGSWGDAKSCSFSTQDLCALYGGLYKDVSNWPAKGSCYSADKPNGWTVMVDNEVINCGNGYYFDIEAFACRAYPNPDNCSSFKGSRTSCEITLPAGSSGSSFYEGSQFNGCKLEVTSSQCIQGGNATECSAEAIFTGQEASPTDADFACTAPRPPKEDPPEPDPEKPCPDGTHLEEGLCVPDDITKPEGNGTEGENGNGPNGGGDTPGGGGDNPSGGGDNPSGGDNPEGNPEGSPNGEGNSENGKCDPSKGECAEEDEKSTASGLTCDQALECKGDAIQCAQLRKQKEIKCATEELYNYDKYESDILATLGKYPQEIDEETVDIKNLVNFSSVNTRWLPTAGCPAPLVINATLSGSNVPIKLDFAGLCAMAESISGIIVGLAALLAVKILAGARV